MGIVGVALALLLAGGDDSNGGLTERAQRPPGAVVQSPEREPQPTAADADGDVVRCEAGVCVQGDEEVVPPVEDADCGASGSWQRLDGGGDQAAFVCDGGSAASLATVPSLAGARLDRAEAFLDQRGLGHDTDGGGTFGIVVRENWTVCGTDPPAGSAVGGTTVTLVVDRDC